MTQTSKGVEILSPAGSEQALIAAVRSGADAVYLGGGSFNARRNAENFNPVTLKKSVEYCHKFGVLVYFTLNISVHNLEIDKALLEAKMANECGVDAFIVSDLGFARVLKRSIKDVVLHGSTQMSVSSPEALPILKKLGFSRIVVAREMSENDLADFCEKAKDFDIEVEAFVHGALCMCLSGQCYLSAMLGSRSGNRGLCAGPCRLPFKTPKTINGYDLSLKDLSLLDYVEKLQSLGIKSFKIEGRMKKPEYVGAVTYAFRQAVDTGVVSDDTKQLLSDVFSRSGFTDGYFTDTVNKSMFGIRTKEDAELSNWVLSTLHSLYRNERQNIGIKAKMVLKQNEPSALYFSDGVHSVSAFGGTPQSAINRPADSEYLKKQISKLGSTPFYLKEFECEIGPNLTLPAAEINELRRLCADALGAERAKTVKKEFKADVSLISKEYKNPLNLKGLYARFDNLDAVPKNLDGINGIILPLDCDFEKAASLHENVILQMPRAYTDKEQIDVLLNKAMPFVKGAFCDTLAAITLCDNKGIKTIGSFGLNVYNSHTASVLEDLNVNGITCSFETHIKNTNAIQSSVPKGAIVYGNLPLMIFKNCPLKQSIGCGECKRSLCLTDRKQKSFNLLCRFGYTELYNSQPLYLADVMPLFSDLDFKILYFTTEDANTAADIIYKYQNLLVADFEYTRGLYKKGVE